jgi:hypothetical protein
MRLPRVTSRLRYGLGLAVAAGVASSSCAQLQGDLQLPAGVPAPQLAPPTVTLKDAALVQAPGQKQLAAYYCPDVVDVPFGGAGILCEGFFGRRPAPAEMAVVFDLHVRISNPNQVPLPLASVLTAITVFPAAINQSLGATCVQLCPAGAAGCTGAATADACQASSRDVRSLADFQQSAVNLLINAGVAMAEGQRPAFSLPPVAASAQADVTIRLSFTPEVLLAVLRQLVVQSKDELKAGRLPSLAIPFRAEGTAFFDAGAVGRIAVGYGPIAGTWTLPVDALLPRN